MKPASRHLSETEFSTLANICRVAGDRFEKDAEIFHKLAAEKPHDPDSFFPEPFLPTGQAAREIARTFEKQALEARDFALLFIAAEPVRINIADEDAPADPPD